MKILHLNSSDLDGGAARAAYRLHKGLCLEKVSSRMLVRDKQSLDSNVIQEKSLLTKLSPKINSLSLKYLNGIETNRFYTQVFSGRLAKYANELKPDIIHLHWIANGYLRIELLRNFRSPIFWTLHDMWPFTGGCIYSNGCDRYQDSCGHCPQLKSENEHDLSKSVWKRKASAWEKLKINLIAPSSSFAECASSSSLFSNRSIAVIPHGLDLSTYKPTAKKVAREILGLPLDKELILFGAASGSTDPRKGFQFLKNALSHLKSNSYEKNFALCIFGDSQESKILDLKFSTYYLGRFRDDISLALVYSAADVMVVPSREETFGQTASEALACGTPVVAFNTMGLKSVVDHELNGYLAKPFESEDLAKGIEWVLIDKERHSKLCNQARKKAESEFSLELQSRRHIDLYAKALNDTEA